MHALLDDRLAPLTSEIGFLEAARDEAVDAFGKWQAPIQRNRGVRLIRHNVSGGLERVLSALLPLTSVERRRHLFVPTVSPWTAYFDNGHQGTTP